jgi:hypothetical protein
MNREMRHGTAYAYNTKGCRCDECRTAASARGKASNAKRRERGLPEGDSRHGTYSGYVNWSCRCRPCTNASMDYQRRLAYGEGAEQLAARLAAQGGVCASCGANSPGTKRGWHTDHNHSTGVVRGILCGGCNVALGMLGEDPARIKALGVYLERSLWGLT